MDNKQNNNNLSREAQKEEREEQEEIKALEFFEATDVIELPIDWLIKGWIPRGVLAIFAGRPEAGKSYLSCRLSADFSNGKLFDGTEHDKLNVLYLTVEDSLQHVIKGRLVKLGADMSRVFLSDEHTIFDDIGLARLAKTISDTQADLVFIDTLGAYNYQADDNKANEVLKPLKGLSEIAKNLKCTIVAIKHLNKTTTQTDYLYRLGGSVAFAGLARIVLMAANDRETNKKILFVAKTNLSMKPNPYFYEITDYGLFLQSCNKSHQEMEEFISSAMQGQLDKKNKDKSDSAVGEAVNWLKTFLSNGKQQAKDVSEQSKISGIAGKTLERAKEFLEIKAYQQKDSDTKKRVWWWELIVNSEESKSDRQHNHIYTNWRSEKPNITDEYVSEMKELGYSEQRIELFIKRTPSFARIHKIEVDKITTVEGESPNEKYSIFYKG